MTRQWCVPSHEGSVLFGTSSVRCRRTDVKREPLVGQPSAPQLIFRGAFGTLQIMRQKCPAKSRWISKAGLGRRKQQYGCAHTSCADTYAQHAAVRLASVARWQHWQSATASSRLLGSVVPRTFASCKYLTYVNLKNLKCEKLLGSSETVNGPKIALVSAAAVFGMGLLSGQASAMPADRLTAAASQGGGRNTAI